MPYLKDQKRRLELQKVVHVMEECHVVADGDLNYLLHYYCKYDIPRTYNCLKNFEAELRETADEIKRRLMEKREDQAMEENGDV